MVRILVMLHVFNDGAFAAAFTVHADVEGPLIASPIPSMTVFPAISAIGSDVFATFLLDIGPGSLGHPLPLTIGTTYNVGIFLTSTSDLGLQLQLVDSTIDIQELPVATG